MSGLFLFAAAFLASGVEMVEALTIILATGITRGWRSAFIGGAVAAIILAVSIAIFGTALMTLVPINILRVVVGTFLLIFGLQWLRKAILRYAGLKAYHDEAGIFAREVRELQGEKRGTGLIDWVGFTVAFKGVLLEGLEVVFIVITFGSNSADVGIAGVNGIGLAAAGAGAALVLVALAGLAIHRPLATVPENTMKFAVGLMLSSFGTFWGGEGVGVNWAGGDATIIALLIVYGLTSWLAISLLRQRVPVQAVR